MGVFVNSGIGAQLVMLPETTYGVAPTLSGAGLMPVEFNTEGLELKKTVVQGKGLHAGVPGLLVNQIGIPAAGQIAVGKDNLGREGRCREDFPEQRVGI